MELLTSVAWFLQDTGLRWVTSCTFKTSLVGCYPKLQLLSCELLYFKTGAKEVFTVITVRAIGLELGFGLWYRPFSDCGWVNLSCLARCEIHGGSALFPLWISEVVLSLFCWESDGCVLHNMLSMSLNLQPC